MGQHYIPQYYLNGFTDLSSKIFQYEKGTSTILPTSTKSVANENHRWSEETESYLANQIEAPANQVIDKIRNHAHITQSEKEILSAYMVVLWRRVPRGLSRTKSYVPKFFDDLNNHIQKLMEANPSKIDVFQNRQQEIKSLRLKFENEFPRELWSEYLKPDVTPQTLATIPKMTWTFLTSQSTQPFLTSDNPVFFFENLGIGRSESEISFPISNTITLWATWRKDVKENFIRANESAIKEINRRTASNMTKYVFYSLSASWVVNLINKKNFRLNRIK